MSASATATPNEPWQDKLVRRFKEEPLVPIGALLTTFTLIMASTKVGRQQSNSMNHWLRARVVAQGATIAAIVGGSYMYGNTKQQQEKAQSTAAAAEELRLREKGEFEARLKAAEEAHALEESLKTQKVVAKSSGGYWSWIGWGSPKTSSSAPSSAPSSGTEKKA